MALIKCPECGKEISDRAKYCINCGFPLEEAEENKICIINGRPHDLSLFQNRLLSVDPNDKESFKKIVDDLYYEAGNISIYAAADLVKQIMNTKKIPATYDGSSLTVRLKKDDGLVYCPKCNSTAVVTGQRGYSMMWGFIGFNRTMNRCAKCGHKWEPKR